MPSITSPVLARRALLATVATAAALIAATPLRAQERHALTGGSAAIWNLAGEVRLEPGTGSDVIVEVTRGGRDGRQLEITASGSQLKIRYPDTRIVYGAGRDGWRNSTSLDVHSDGTFDGDWRSSGRRTTVRSYGDGLEAHADLVIKVPAGQRVEVNLAVGLIEATNVQGDLLLDVHSADVNATGTKGRLTIDAGSGAVRVERAEGDLSVDTGSGSTTLSDLKMTTVIIEAGSGSVTARTLEAQRFSVDIGSGGITGEAVGSDDLRVETGSGSVRIELTRSPRRTDIDTGSGSVSLTLPADLSADLDISTGSGGITSDFPVTMQEFGRRELRGRIGAGGPMIKVSTGSGGVRLYRR